MAGRQARDDWVLKATASTGVSALAKRPRGVARLIARTPNISGVTLITIRVTMMT